MRYSTWARWESAESFPVSSGSPETWSGRRRICFQRNQVERHGAFPRRFRPSGILAQEGVGEALRVGADVEDFVRRDAGPGAGGHVADGVVAGLAVRQPDVGQKVHQIGDPMERDEVVLDVLPRGEVAASAAEFVGNARQLAHLESREQPARDLAAHHLHAGLALAVDAVFQAKRTEVVLGNVPSQKRNCLGPESFDLLPNRSIILILKLFPLRNGFLDGCRHNRLHWTQINHLNIHRDYPIWPLKRKGSPPPNNGTLGN